jgi:RNA polymerase sigma-70 factor (ECF subfamily)
MLLSYLTVLESPEDRSAFENIYLTYRDRMMNIAMEILKNQYDAEDALHQAFLKLMNHMDYILNKQSHEIWRSLVIIIRNVSIDIYRAHGRSKEVPFEEFYDSMEENGEVSVLTVSDIEYSEILEALRRLPPQYVDILTLKYLEDLSVTKIA